MFEKGRLKEVLMSSMPAKTVLVTGAAGGIGAVVEALAEAEWMLKLRHPSTPPSNHVRSAARPGFPLI